MKLRLTLVTTFLATLVAVSAQTPLDLNQIDTVVLIFAENRSFDMLYGKFPNANGLAQAAPIPQVDRSGAVLRELPPVWGGLTAIGVTPPVTEAETAHLPNAPFALDDLGGFNTPASVPTRELVHRFYQNQMQIHGGRNDRFVAYGDSGALVMAHYDGSSLPMWAVAKEYTLADNFFMGAFGGSFLNHQYLICACVPYYPNANRSRAQPVIARVNRDGVTLTLDPDSPRSALEGPPRFLSDGTLTPDFFAVNTMQPPYQPSYVPPMLGGDPALADARYPSTLPPQTARTIGDLLSAKGISWAWYAGAWQLALDGKGEAAIPNFQYHHQPFNYFAAMAPRTAARAEHLRDGGLDGVEFLAAVDRGALPHVAIYKPQGNLNEHPNYADVLTGDRHIAEVVARLQKSPQWPHMLVIVTYDENGGFWDHVAPPKGDRWGPGIRVPTIIVSPFAKRGFVDHTLYDTSSILRFITRRFDLPPLAGLTARDRAMAPRGQRMGDLTGALDLPRK